VAGINRLDPDHLREWRKAYEDLRAAFLAGRINLFEARGCFQHLGFKRDALRTELLDLQKQKNRAA
jgi:hypothetical protein